MTGIGLDASVARVRACMQQALKLTDAEADALSLDTTPATVAGWTSMAHLELILAVEREFGVAFEAEEIARLASMRALVTAVERTRV